MKEEIGKDRGRFIFRVVVTLSALFLVIYIARELFWRPSPSPTHSKVSGFEKSTNSPASGESAIISWRDASKHYGEYLTVEGKIVATHNSGKACFLNFHPDYRRYFTAVIFASSFSRFPSNPEKYYYGKTVRVTGYIKEYNGKPEIILNDPSQIEIVNESNYENNADNKEK